MTLALRRVSGIDRFAKLRVNTGAGTKAAQRARVRTSAGLKTFFRDLAASGPSAVTVNPDQVSGARNSMTPALVVSQETTVTATAGTAPFTYAWSQVSGDPMTIANPAGAKTAFSATVPRETSMTGVFKCTVTDALEVSAESPEVTAFLINLGSTL